MRRLTPAARVLYHQTNPDRGHLFVSRSAMATLERNELHYGDNLTVMREKIPDEIADLIYLDPPFNSARNYNLL